MSDCEFAARPPKKKSALFKGALFTESYNSWQLKALLTDYAPAFWPGLGFDWGVGFREPGFYLLRFLAFLTILFLATFFVLL